MSIKHAHADDAGQRRHLLDQCIADIGAGIRVCRDFALAARCQQKLFCSLYRQRGGKNDLVGFSGRGRERMQEIRLLFMERCLVAGDQRNARNANDHQTCDENTGIPAPGLPAWRSSLCMHHSTLIWSKYQRTGTVLLAGKPARRNASPLAVTHWSEFPSGRGKTQRSHG